MPNAKAGRWHDGGVDFTDRAVMRYLHDVEASTDPVLREMESRAEREGFPIIGPLVGRTCALLAQAIQARTVFEMGSGFGYSTYHFATVLSNDGLVVHTDGDARRSDEAKAYLSRAHRSCGVEYHVGDALEILARDNRSFDVVFIDVDKHQYPEAFRIARAHLNPGGLMLVDNTLWSGKVADPAIQDAATRGARTLNQLALADPGLAVTILPLRDGLTVALRRR